ncbi:27 kDa outer membrane protein, putative [Oceaniovalibus guishaninsula JLT2003]|uniref:27 kDa outer membrane protein, putative n=1 Tax=Oceaniovalibus guishaninsula JLT2003 TaxID=1231392 RepID=K2HFA5_9RHOB|nr:DsbA family protein [Oceaniovalibus guishaninsula]EKE45137.1 27 kDa outer membrane protein, putative [Oceaniovalibus guishaninsula JLT2003]
MLKALPLALLAFAAPAAADIAAMTDAERETFRAEVRDYLMENPEVLMEAIGVLETRQAEAQAAGDSQIVAANRDALTGDGHSWVGGNPEGDLTVVEFMDYRCGYCRRAAPEVAELLESDGNIRLIVKEFPILGEQSVLASRFAIATLREAGDAAYETVHDALIALRGDVTPEALADVARAADLDAQAILAGMDDAEVDRIITENHALAQALAINGTPSFVIGDQLVRGYVPLEAMQQIVEAEREG